MVHTAHIILTRYNSGRWIMKNFANATSRATCNATWLTSEFGLLYSCLISIIMVWIKDGANFTSQDIRDHYNRTV